MLRPCEFACTDLLSFESEFTINTNSNEYKAGDKLHEFGACNNCHFYGETKPIQGAQTWAPNLAMTKDRLRPEWVIEWMRDPQLIMPGTKMPAPYLPTQDILQVFYQKMLFQLLYLQLLLLIVLFFL